VRTFADCLELLRLGEENRATRETHMNMASSRSHSIFTLLVEQTRPSLNPGGEPRELRSKFNLVMACFLIHMEIFPTPRKHAGLFPFS
jgi:kinesin family protein 3/17